jgi:hypothetical protein
MKIKGIKNCLKDAKIRKKFLSDIIIPKIDTKKTGIIKNINLYGKLLKKSIKVKISIVPVKISFNAYAGKEGRKL